MFLAILGENMQIRVLRGGNFRETFDIMFS